MTCRPHPEVIGCHFKAFRIFLQITVAALLYHGEVYPLRTALVTPPPPTRRKEPTASNGTMGKNTGLIIQMPRRNVRSIADRAKTTTQCVIVQCQVRDEIRCSCRRRPEHTLFQPFRILHATVDIPLLAHHPQSPIFTEDTSLRQLFI